MNRAAPTGVPRATGGEPARSRKGLPGWVIGVLLVAVTWLVYWPAGSYDFINFDDHEYVSENPHVLRGLTWSGVVWAFGTVHASNWHPLTWLSHMLDAQWFGPGPQGPHLVNVALHAANAVLVFLLLWRLTGGRWRSAFVAALFALHPLHVESVAWISERKDVLSGLFFLLTVFFWTRGWSKVERRASRAGMAVAEQAGPPEVASAALKHEVLGALDARRSTLDYVLALCFFALGLMSKPMLVTLPFVLLLLDYWPLRRFTIGDLRFTGGRLVFEKLPFFGLSLASCVVTFLAQKQGGAVQSLAGYSWSARLENALVSYARYLGKMFWPVDLALPYPHPGQWPAAVVILAGVLLAVVSAAVIWLGRERRHWLVGWFWFVGLLVPVIGLVQVGAQSMADRYVYLPMIGILILGTWGIGELVERRRGWRLAGAAAALAIVAACGWRAAGQLAYWRNSGTLAGHAIAVTRNNDIAHSNLGNYLLEQGQLDEAIDQFRLALLTMWQPGRAPADPVAALIGSGGEEGGASAALLQADPKKLKACTELLNNLATALARKGRVDDGIGLFRLVLRIKPDHALALHNLAFELAARKEYADAIRLYEAALRARPDQVKTLNSLGAVLAEVGRVDEAVGRYRAALQLSPDDAEVHLNLGLALAAQGRAEEAVAHYEAALRADPRRIEVRNTLGSALIGMGRIEDGMRHLQALLREKPDHARAHDNLGVALAMQGRLDEAIREFEESLRHDPDNAKTHFNAGNALALQRRFEEAARRYRETLRLVPDHAQAHCHLGSVLAELGRREEAIAHVREALRLKPGYAEAARQLEALE